MSVILMTKQKFEFGRKTQYNILVVAVKFQLNTDFM